MSVSPPADTPEPLTEDQERQRVALTHLFAGIFGFLPPLVVRQRMRGRSLYVSYEATKALNFQLLVLGGYVVSALLTFVMIGFITGIALWVFSVSVGMANFNAVLAKQPTRFPVEVQIVS